jgi:peptidoglycan/LPS O-acetylase OafA/YrhL
MTLTQVNLVGTAMMPMFFLLSGFVLVLHDGQTLWSKQSTAFSSGTEQHEDSALPKFDTIRFYHKRAARILPVYYLTSALAVITTLLSLNAL